MEIKGFILPEPKKGFTVTAFPDIWLFPINALAYASAVEPISPLFASFITRKNNCFSHKQLFFLVLQSPYYRITHNKLIVV